MNNEKETEVETQNEKLTVFDAVLAALYLVIIAIGVVMCITHGLGGTVYHLLALTVCIWGVLAAKILKYRKDIKGHVGELIFIAVMCVVSVLTLVGTLV
ncbi:MAG: hypothetical protein E7656_09775 [Ruminococcaceae bacterium]|nr:hypothetical protein [Oscillospiraceae bacterium]